MQFIKNLLTSCLGTVLGLGLLTFIVVIIVSRMGNDSPTVKANSVLKLTLGGELPELSNNTERDNMDFSSFFSEAVGLNDFDRLIDKAMKDNNIKGIYLEIAGVNMGFATTKKVQQKLAQFRKSGKFVVAYSTMYSQKAYYLASGADKIYLHPLGNLEFLGFSGQLMYYKGLMDKIGVKAQIYYAGKFKSATEPFRRADMSPENRLQTSQFINGFYELYLQTIAQNRNLDAVELRRLANEAVIRKADDALTHKLVDGLKYKDEILTELRERLGLKEKDEIPVVSLAHYREVHKDELANPISKKNKIAVVYAEGSIVDGEGEQGSIGGDNYAREIRKLREDEHVKAIVLRVNSGGGSALASDIIWREIEMAKKQGIHIVTSMGDVAASGGYYIACNSHRIFAEDNTITGSIGVFGMIPNMRGLYDKMGLTMDTVKTTKYANMGSDMGNYYEFTPEEGAIIQTSVDDIYMIFKKRVSDGRGMDIAMVDSFAQGRVWLGSKAKEIGLVDSLGGLKEAIAEAAKLSNLTEYEVAHYPEVKSFKDKFLSSLGGDSEKKSEFQQTMSQFQEKATSVNIPELRELQKLIKEVHQIKGIQMRMPYKLIIN